MADIYTDTDYRKFLVDRIAYCKKGNPAFSYRYIARRAGFNSAGYVTQVIQGKSNLSVNMIQRLAAALDLRKREADYFGLCVMYNQAKTHDEKKNYFEKMLGYKKGRVRTLDPDEFLFYDRWYYSAIRAVLNYYPFKDDYQELASMLVPKITAAEAKKAIAVLEKLGLICRNADGTCVLTQRHITTGLNTDALVINNFVLNTLEIAKNAFYSFRRDDRSYSALTISVSKQGYLKIKNHIDNLRQELIKIVDTDRDMDRVCQINFQLFPLTDIKGDGEK